MITFIACFHLVIFPPPVVQQHGVEGSINLQPEKHSTWFLSSQRCFPALLWLRIDCGEQRRAEGPLSSVSWQRAVCRRAETWRGAAEGLDSSVTARWGAFILPHSSSITGWPRLCWHTHCSRPNLGTPASSIFRFGEKERTCAMRKTDKLNTQMLRVFRPHAKKQPGFDQFV